MTEAFVAQSSIGDSLDRGFAGMPTGSSKRRVAPMKTASRKFSTVAFTAVNATHYIVTITQNGVAVAYDYTSDGSATTAECVAGVVALINAGTQFVHATGTDTPMSLYATGDGNKGTFTVAFNGNMVETVVAAGNQAITAGLFVTKDDLSVDGVARLPNVAADVTSLRASGVVLANNYTRVNGGVLAANRMASVMSGGMCLVKVEAAVTDGAAVYIRYAAGGNGQGSFMAGTGSSEGALLPNARYRSTAAADGIAVVELNLPG